MYFTFSNKLSFTPPLFNSNIIILITRSNKESHMKNNSLQQLQDIYDVKTTCLP